MSLPTYQDFYTILLKNGTNPKTADEYLAVVANELKINDEDLSLRHPSGEGIIRNRIRWAIHYLRRAQLLTKPSRGIYVITERGREFLKKHPNGFNNSDLTQFEEFNEFRRHLTNDIDSKKIILGNEVTTSELTPTERLEAAARELDEDLQRELLERILDQPPSFFERLVVTLLSEMGYGSEGTLARAIGKSGDGGVDGVIHQDRLGLDVVYIQAKRYDTESQISRPELQAFVGSLAGHQSTKGVFVTTSYFSKPALEYLRTIQTRIVPIDGKRLVELMIEHEVGTRVAQTFKVNKIDEDFFLD